MQLLPRNIYKRSTFQISRNTDNIPSNYNLFCKIITTLLFVMP